MGADAADFKHIVLGVGVVRLIKAVHELSPSGVSRLELNFSVQWGSSRFRKP